MARRPQTKWRRPVTRCRHCTLSLMLRVRRHACEGCACFVRCVTARDYPANDKMIVPGLEYEADAALAVGKLLGLRQPLHVNRLHFAGARDSESGGSAVHCACRRRRGVEVESGADMGGPAAVGAAGGWLEGRAPASQRHAAYEFRDGGCSRGHGMGVH